MTQRRLKIAISIWCFKPETGGLQAYAEQLCWELQQRGHDVFVVTRAATRVPQGRDYLFFNERAASLSVKNIPVKPLRFAKAWRPVLWLLGKFVVRRRFQAIGVQLYKLVSRKPARLAFRDVDLIHHISEASPLNGFAAAAAAKHWGIPFVVSPTCHPHHVGDSPLDLRLYRQANRLLVYTEYEAQYLREKLAGWTIDVVGIGIEDRFDGSAEQFRAGTGIAGPFILFIGRKDPQKGYPLLIDAFKIVRRQRPECTLVCMGPAGSAIMPKDVDGVIELDFTSDQVKHDALAGCTCLCVPSEGESFGLVFMEAGRYGKPVVGRKVPVLQELLGASGGGLLLGQPDRMRNKAALKPEELAGALLDLITNPQECRRLGENCRLISDGFLWRHKIQGYEESYRRTLEEFHHGQHGNQPIP